MTDLLAAGETMTAQRGEGLRALPSAGAPETEPYGPGGSRARRSEVDRLTQFRPAILAVRWATTGVSVALAAATMVEPDPWLAAWVSLVLVNTIFRTLRPLRDEGTLRQLVALIAEIGLHVMAVIATGYWDSPVVLILINAIIIAGFARGFGFALRMAAASTLAVTVPGIGDGWGAEELARSAQWATLLTLSGIVAGYTRRISGEATRRHDLALDRVTRLADANALLSELHRIAQTLPASLDQAEVLDSTVSRLRTLVGFETLVILVDDSQGDLLTVTRQQGANLADTVSAQALPGPAQRALSLQRLQHSNELGSADRPLSPSSQAGLYVPLLARGHQIGLLAIETVAPDGYGDRDRQMLAGFVEPVALAIDNARWFDRIRTVGADEERTRIARDLHDRVGQSLAYFGFEIDRLIRSEANGEPLGPSSTPCGRTSARSSSRCATPCPTCGRTCPTTRTSPPRPRSSRPDWPSAASSPSTSTATPVPASRSCRNGRCGASPRRRW